jgi:hypothetical protein
MGRARRRLRKDRNHGKYGKDRVLRGKIYAIVLLVRCDMIPRVEEIYWELTVTMLL